MKNTRKVTYQITCTLCDKEIHRSEYTFSVGMHIPAPPPPIGVRFPIDVCKECGEILEKCFTQAQVAQAAKMHPEGP